jgi:hypothetical protein
MQSRGKKAKGVGWLEPQHTYCTYDELICLHRPPTVSFCLATYILTTSVLDAFPARAP